jgi:hypothetical protein
MENGGDNASANNSPGDSALPDNIPVVTSGNTDVVGALETFGGTVLTVLGFLFVEIGLGIAGFILCFLGIGCCIFVICHHVKDSQFKYPKLLLWSLMICNVVLFAFLIRRESTKSNPTIIETRAEGWQPPELPSDCSNVVLRFGTYQISEPVWAATVPPTRGSVKFQRNEAPTEITNLWGRSSKPMFFWVYSMMDVGGHSFATPVMPYVKNRRLFVYAQTPIGGEMRKIEMNNEWDTKIPDGWDRNFNANAFEIVNESGRPVLQVLYRKSNEMDVSGIFVVGTNETLAAFGWIMILFSPQTNGTFNAYMQGIKPPTNIESFYVPHNDPFATELSQQKCIFKYPSWKHPGELAE